MYLVSSASDRARALCDPILAPDHHSGFRELDLGLEAVREANVVKTVGTVLVAVGVHVHVLTCLSETELLNVTNH